MLQLIAVQDWQVDTASSMLPEIMYDLRQIAPFESRHRSDERKSRLMVRAPKTSSALLECRSSSCSWQTPRRSIEQLYSSHFLPLPLFHQTACIRHRTPRPNYSRFPGIVSSSIIRQPTSSPHPTISNPFYAE